MKFRLRLDAGTCKACGLCVAACLRSVLRLSLQTGPGGVRAVEVARPQDCEGCRRCTDICPEAAIEIDKEERLPLASKPARPAAPEPATAAT